MSQAVGHPGVELAEVGGGVACEGGGLEVAIGTELGGHGDGLEAALELGLPEGAPPCEVGAEGGLILGSAGVWDLGPLIVADAGVDVEDAACAEGEDIREEVEDEALCDDAPVAEVDGELEVRELAEEVAGDDGVE